MAEPRGRPDRTGPPPPKTLPIAESLAERELLEAGVSGDVARLIVAIQRQVDNAYREQATATAEALVRQAASITRLSTLVEQLIERLPPTTGDAPIRALAFASNGEADLTSLPEGIAADPIGAGYSLSQTDVARILRCSAGDLGILLKETRVREDIRFAVQVRTTNPIWNYHRRVLDELLRYIEGDASPEAGSKAAVSALARIVRARGAVT